MKITNEENLRMEVQVLKLQNAQLLKSVYAEKMAQAEKDEQAAITSLNDLRQELSTKYDIPVQAIRVTKDGEIFSVNAPVVQATENGAQT